MYPPLDLTYLYPNVCFQRQSSIRFDACSRRYLVACRRCLWRCFLKVSGIEYIRQSCPRKSTDILVDETLSFVFVSNIFCFHLWVHNMMDPYTLLRVQGNVNQQYDKFLENTPAEDDIQVVHYNYCINTWVCCINIDTYWFSMCSYTALKVKC